MVNQDGSHAPPPTHNSTSHGAKHNLADQRWSIRKDGPHITAHKSTAHHTTRSFPTHSHAPYMYMFRETYVPDQAGTALQ